MELYKKRKNGFGVIHPEYVTGSSSMIISESVGVRKKQIWIGESHCIDKINVKKLIKYLQTWINTDSLKEV